MYVHVHLAELTIFISFHNDHCRCLSYPNSCTYKHLALIESKGFKVGHGELCDSASYILMHRLIVQIGDIDDVAHNIPIPVLKERWIPAQEDRT